MEDGELADEIIRRLNALIEDQSVRADVEALIEHRVACSQATADHPSIQAVPAGDGSFLLGLLGILNGLAGTIPDGERAGWGLIAAEYDDGTGRLVRFRRTASG